MLTLRQDSPQTTDNWALEWIHWQMVQWTNNFCLLFELEKGIVNKSFNWIEIKDLSSAPVSYTNNKQKWFICPGICPMLCSGTWYILVSGDCHCGVSVAVFITLKGFQWCLKCQCGGEQGNLEVGGHWWWKWLLLDCFWHCLLSWEWFHLSTNMMTLSVCSCRVYKHASNNFSY